MIVRSVSALTVVRAGPRDDAEQVTQALPGDLLTVEADQSGWARVRTAYDYPGWVLAEALDGAVDEGWLVERARDPVEEARAYLGCPYEWGGMSERGIDCSGLIHMAYRRLGRLVPRDADQQEEAGIPVAARDLHRGDLVWPGGRPRGRRGGTSTGAGRAGARTRPFRVGTVPKETSASPPGRSDPFGGRP